MPKRAKGRRRFRSLALDRAKWPGSMLSHYPPALFSIAEYRSANI